MKKQTKLESFLSIIGAVIIALAIRSVVFEPYSIPSGSMKPNFLVGDYLFVSKYPYGFSNTSILFEPDIIEDRVLEFSKPKRGEVIVFKPEHSHYNGFIFSGVLIFILICDVSRWPVIYIIISYSILGVSNLGPEEI